MKRFSLAIAVASLSLLGLSACATMDEDYYASSSPQVDSSRLVIDTKQVALIEAINRRQGSRVIWINMPTKRVSIDSSGPDRN